ncbi:IS3 family transposase [Micromonospora carbonacea]|uniref:IS3 family transposase n=1 Tax=Micromonospora carbonacea TaxID=47853 RepID=UPI003710D8E2
MTQQAWPEHRGVHGARRLTAELHERGHRWNRKSVARLMRLAGIEGAHRRRRGEGRRKAASTATAGPGPAAVHRDRTQRLPSTHRAPDHRHGNEKGSAPG